MVEYNEQRGNVKLDIADILELRDPNQFLGAMQEEFQGRVGPMRCFRVTATPSDLGEVSASLSDSTLLGLLEKPPGRDGGWTVKPVAPLRRNALGFENDRTDFQHLKFIRNGHLEFWTAIDDHFCWRQDATSFKQHPRLYPYAVVEYPLSFCRLYKELVNLLAITSKIILQMQYINVEGVVLLPFRPDSIGFMHPIDPIKPSERGRLVFAKHVVPHDYDPDLATLDLVEDLYFQFGYSRQHIPFFGPSGHVTEL